MTEQPPGSGQQPPQNPYDSSPYQAYGTTGASGLPHWAPDHPQASTVLILGILGMAVCQVIAPFAWVMGSRVKKEIEAPGSQYGGRSQVQVGYVLGIVGSCLLGLYVLGALAYVAIIAVAVSTGA
ncbi:DUF4190 domain-containing protein [Nocardioides antri]|uniref:DUF4190 domain-containing protein n=1 Tax=Nocardioides antri TaxID=2607659 RepID=UPI00165F9BBD|nr:DUF4190 domain-containing protein [Nocardioides antri]